MVDRSVDIHLCFGASHSDDRGRIPQNDPFAALVRLEPHEVTECGASEQHGYSNGFRVLSCDDRFAGVAMQTREVVIGGSGQERQISQCENSSARCFR